MSHILNSAGRFRGTLDEAALYNPLQQSGIVFPGLPFMRLADGTNRPGGLDLPLMKKKGLGGIATLSVGIIGDQGHGKTLLMNVFCARQPMYQVGDDPFMRISFDSEKRNAGEKPETYELSKFVNDTREDGMYVVPLDQASFNPFRMHEGMRIWYEDCGEEWDPKKFHLTGDDAFEEVYDLLTSIFETTGKNLSDIEHELLDIMTQPMMRDESRSMSELLRRLQLYSHPFTRRQLEAELGFSEDEPLLVDQFEKEYSKAALSLYLRVRRLLKGKTRRLVNGKDSKILEYMSSKMVSFDFKGLSDEARTIGHLILWKLRASANLHNFRDRFSHINVHDESYDKWRILSFARAMYLNMKTLRERGAIEVSIFHRLKDMESVSSAGTEQARYAENAVNEIAVWFIGRQPRSEFDRLRKRFGLPQAVLNTLPTLRKGFFWLIVGNLAPQLVYIVPTKEELERFNTDAANDRLLAGYYATNDPELYLDYLESITPRYADDPDQEDRDVPHQESETEHEMAPA